MALYMRQHVEGTEYIHTGKPHYKYALRWVTEEHGGELRTLGYEIVDVALGLIHSSNQVIYASKSLKEAEMFCHFLNKQEDIERE